MEPTRLNYLVGDLVYAIAKSPSDYEARVVRIARQTGTAVVVVRDGKLVEERQAAPEPAAPKP